MYHIEEKSKFHYAKKRTIESTEALQDMLAYCNVRLVIYVDQIMHQLLNIFANIR